MAEEKREKKKPGIIKQILKWIGLGLLTALILGALVLDAPWKVLSLLLIILTASTILPKGTVKWFWLSVATVVVVLIIWVFLPDENGNWQPYKYNFDEELTAIEAKYVIPDELNAATIYNKLLQDYDEEVFYTNLSPEDQEKLPMRESWLSKDHPKMAEWIQQQQNTIEKLLEASKIDQCLFRINDPANFEKQINRYAAMRRWAFLLVSAANNDIAENRIKEGFQKNMALLQMGKHLYQQPSTTDWLVGTAIEAIGIDQLKTFVITEDATEEYLSSIEKALTGIKYDWNSDFLKILKSDELSATREFARYYEINPKGKIRLSRDPLGEMRSILKKQLENNEIKEQQYQKSVESLVYLTYWQKKLIKAQTILLWFYLPSSPEKAADLIKIIYQKYYEMARPDYNWAKEPREIRTTPQFKFRLNRYRTIELLASVSEEPYYRIQEIYLRRQTGIRASRSIIALRRYKNQNGRWPENLDEIKPFAPAEIFVDPINGNSFVYKLADDSFKLYSKGKNNIDEDGKRDRWGEERTGADDWLIWPPHGQKTKTGEKPQK
jgi:hypothetical protein